jgi:UDP-N-acetylglucosamine 4,6-dehydratase/5-epimerase
VLGVRNGGNEATESYAFASHRRDRRALRLGAGAVVLRTSPRSDGDPRATPENVFLSVQAKRREDVRIRSLLLHDAKSKRGDQMFKGLSVMITGGTGSFGKHCLARLLEETDAKRIVIYSRDELKQSEMMRELSPKHALRTRFFLGCVRDRDRLLQAMQGCHLVIHAAALKQVPALEYNPSEAILTNVIGSQNVIWAAIQAKVQAVVALSTDKACQPANLYGATKLCAEKLFQAAHAYVGKGATRFNVVRYGNVINSRGSVIPIFREQAAKGVMEITDERMTRFWITLNEACGLVFDALLTGHDGETFIPKLPSVKITDIAQTIGYRAKKTIFTGIRPGEKLHETLMSSEESRNAVEYPGAFVINPNAKRKLRGQLKVADGFVYSSDTNVWQLDGKEVEFLLGGQKQ